MRALALLALTACTLDASSKPECVEDDHCNYPPGHCVEQVCYRNVAPTGRPDVIYVHGPDATSVVVVDVVRNDVDPEGDPMRIAEVRRDDPSTGSIWTRSSTTVEIRASQVPATYGYRVRDDDDVNEDWIPITLAKLPSALTIPVEAGTSVSLTNVLGSIVDTSQISLITAPAVGSLAGTLPDVSYVPPADFCGTDMIAYRIAAANGTFDVAIMFEVGILLNDEERDIEFGSSTTIDVLADERGGLELVAVDHATATISTGKDTLIVTPPVNVGGSYTIEYTAKDSRECEGRGALTVNVSFPTRVVVGEGLTGDAFDATLSADGRFLAFTSADATIVSGDTNGTSDVFVLDLATNTTERVSVASNGTQANEGSSNPTISADGRWVAFVSRATNLAAADTTSIEDIYLHDRTTGTTTLVSVSIDNTGSDHASLTPHISADGTRIVFASSATRLVSGDTNDVLDIFLRDTTTSTTIRVSQTSAGAQAPFAAHVRPRVSGNGRYVALSTSSSLDGTNQSGTFLVDTAGSAVSRIDSSGEVDIDDVGRFIAQANGSVNIVDRVVENKTSLGAGTYPALSADGRFVAYANLKGVLARGTGTPVEVSVDRAGAPVAAAPLRRPELSGDGRWVVYSTSEWPGYQGRFVIVRVYNLAHTGS